MQNAAVPISAIFSCAELVSFGLLVTIACKLSPGSEYVYSLSLDTSLIGLCALVSLVCSIYAFEEEEYPIAVFALSQSFSDLGALILGIRAVKNRLRRGPASYWRAVLSCAMAIGSIVFVTAQRECRALLISALILRSIWTVLPVVMRKWRTSPSTTHRREDTIMDEWGLLTNRSGSLEGSARVYISFPDDGDDDDDDMDVERNQVEEPLLSSLLVLPPPDGGSRNNSDSTTDSAESFALVRPGSALGGGPFGVTSNGAVMWGSSSSASVMTTRHADDAAGPMPDPSQLLPTQVSVISYKEVLTTGGVPLVVYVLQTDRNEISVHRYGEFRALCNRVVSKFYHDCGAEAPTFPGRRVFRKLLPQAMGGVVQGAAADREFIATRAAGLGDWTQKVLDSVRAQPHSDATTMAMADFLRPIVHHAPDTDLEQTVRTAVLIFADTVLNPVAPPSPCL